MELKLNVQKRGLSTKEEVLNEEYTLHYGHIFRGEDGERGADGKSAYQLAVEAGYNKSESEFASDLSKISGNSYTDDDKAWVDEIPSIKETIDYLPDMLENKQDVLTLTTKPNGNIVIGNLAGQTKEFMPATPSGDPMHYAYEAVGAVWNASTEYWEFLGVKNMTNEDMLEEYTLGNSRIYPSANVIYLSTTERVIFGKRLLLDSEWSALKADNLSPFNARLEVVQFSTHEHLPVFLSSFAWGCYECKRLKTFLNILDVSMGGLNSAFGGCVALETIMLRGLKNDVSFADSPLLSKESLLYMINNCASGVSFTITLHPDVDDKWQTEWLEDIDYALGRAEVGENTNITLARA